jgi:hypothetical protein
MQAKKTFKHLTGFLAGRTNIQETAPKQNQLNTEVVGITTYTRKALCSDRLISLTPIMI